MRSPFLASLVALSLSACAAAPSAPDAATTPLAAGPAVTAGSLSGLVVAPAIISTGGGNIISTGGGNIIATGGLNYRLLAVPEQPLADTEVYLADQAGQPLLGVAPVKTDVNGRYTFQNVPPNQSFVVAARVLTRAGAPATLRTVVKTEASGTEAHLNAATTMVSSVVLKKKGALEKFQPGSYRAAVDATTKHLTEAHLPDFSDPAAVLAKMESLASEIAEIKSRLTEIEEQLAEVKAEVTELRAQLEALKKQLAGSSDSCEKSFEAFDADGNGAISGQEWSVAYRASKGGSAEDEKATFDLIDEDHDGRWDAGEFSQIACGDEEETPSEPEEEAPSKGNTPTGTTTGTGTTVSTGTTTGTGTTVSTGTTGTGTTVSTDTTTGTGTTVSTDTTVGTGQTDGGTGSDSGDSDSGDGGGLGVNIGIGGIGIKL